MSERRENERKDTIPYIALLIAGGYLLATCMLMAFLLGVLVAGPLTKTFAPNILPLVKMYAANPKDGLGNRQGGGYKAMGTVAIIPGKGGAEFNPPFFKLPAGNTVTWINKTQKTQMLISDSNSKNISLAPGLPMSMSLPQGGSSYTWHLASNPQASITIYVGG